MFVEVGGVYYIRLGELPQFSLYDWVLMKMAQDCFRGGAPVVGDPQ
jgi:hypothetical protein